MILMIQSLGYNVEDGFFLKMVYRYSFTGGDHHGKLLLI